MDTTGAGDQFAAGFLYGFLNNKTLEECGKLGADAAAKIIQQVGAKPNIPFSELLTKN
ncbi:MAG: PfkB family carbohydrate kinase [Candidatus Rickettsia vulgarisii]